MGVGVVCAVGTDVAVGTAVAVGTVPVAVVGSVPPEVSVLVGAGSPSEAEEVGVKVTARISPGSGVPVGTSVSNGSGETPSS